MAVQFPTPCDLERGAYTTPVTRPENRRSLPTPPYQTPQMRRIERRSLLPSPSVHTRSFQVCLETRSASPCCRARMMDRPERGHHQHRAAKGIPTTTHIGAPKD